MNAPLSQTFRLAPRGGSGLACDDAGVALGPVNLVEAFRDAEGRLRFRTRPAADLAKALTLAYGADAEIMVARRHQGLARVAELLAAGEGARARIHAVLLRFPDVDDEGMAKLTRAATLGKFNPDWASEDRAPKGQPGAEEWTSTGGGGGTAKTPKKKAPPPEDVPAKKRRFVGAHFDDAQKAADQLHVPVENVLGLSALEGGWGVTSRFAKEGNNYFGVYYPAPYATGMIVANDNPKARMARFASYADGAQAFVAISRSIVSGKSDPAEFAKALQDSGKFGIDPMTGKPEPGYVASVASTIRGLRPYIANRKSEQ
jgi:Mannosyl-glycoprotein endo-beta-N-acetylglucosaminidase